MVSLYIPHNHTGQLLLAFLCKEYFAPHVFQTVINIFNKSPLETQEQQGSRVDLHVNIDVGRYLGEGQVPNISPLLARLHTPPSSSEKPRLGTIIT